MDQSGSFGEQTWDNFIKLYAHHPYLKEKASLVAGDSARIVDPSGLVIDALLRAAKKYDPEEIHNLKAWITKIVVNEVLSRLRLAEVRARSTNKMDLRWIVGQNGEETRRLERLEKEAYLYRLLEMLPESDREVICMSRIEEMADPEVADLLEISGETLRQRRSRAMARLKELAKKYPFAE